MRLMMDAEGHAVTELAEIDAFHIKVLDETQVAFCFQRRVGFDQSFFQKFHFLQVVDGRFPVREFTFFIPAPRCGGS